MAGEIQTVWIEGINKAIVIILTTTKTKIMKRLKQIIVMALVAVSSFNANAQIGSTYEDVIRNYGKPESSKIVNKMVKSIGYNYYFSISDLKEIPCMKNLLFIIKGDSLEACSIVVMTFELKNINSVVNFVKKKNFVKTGDLKWMDYSRNIEYSINKDDEYCRLVEFLL